MQPNAETIRSRMRKLANPEKAKILQGFFKTSPGEYGEGDIFTGIVVPELRKLVKQFDLLPLAECEKLVHSRMHEERLLGLLIWVAQYKKAPPRDRAAIFARYVRSVNYINNWDLVDLTAEHVLGAHLVETDKSLLYRWARSKNLWKRRLSMLATFHYIKKGDFGDPLNIADMLLLDPEDLIQKAVGWMLREIGKRDLRVEEDFLKSRYKTMPRTMLRYAIERFAEIRRKAYLKGDI